MNEEVIRFSCDLGFARDLFKRLAYMNAEISISASISLSGFDGGSDIHRLQFNAKPNELFSHRVELSNMLVHGTTQRDMTEEDGKPVPIDSEKYYIGIECPGTFTISNTKTIDEILSLAGEPTDCVEVLFMDDGEVAIFIDENDFSSYPLYEYEIKGGSWNGTQ